MVWLLRSWLLRSLLSAGVIWVNLLLLYTNVENRALYSPIVGQLMFFSDILSACTTYVIKIWSENKTHFNIILLYVCMVNVKIDVFIILSAWACECKINAQECILWMQCFKKRHATGCVYRTQWTDKLIQSRGWVPQIALTGRVIRLFRHALHTRL